jgi:hypothetical protein
MSSASWVEWMSLLRLVSQRVLCSPTEEDRGLSGVALEVSLRGSTPRLSPIKLSSSKN